MHQLVDAHIKGRAAHKRGFDEYFTVKGKTVKSCAVGAIYYGLFGKVPDGPPQLVPTQIAGDWPQFRTFMTKIPCEHKVVTDVPALIEMEDEGNIAGILIHLNDHHPKDWTDKKIQEWLAKTLEEHDRIQALPQV